MNDDKVSRPSEEITQERQLRSVNEKIAYLSETIAELNQWKVTLEGKVEPSHTGSFGLKLTFKKGDGNGFIYSVTADIARGYQGDPEALVQELVELAYERLLREHMRNEFTEIITKGLRNVQQLNGRAL